MLKSEQILNSLEPFCFAIGSPVIVHTSLKSIGEIEGGAQTLLLCLKKFFTKNGGLLCIPTHTWDTCFLDLRKNESCLGVLPRTAAADKSGKRSLHPTHSMTVFGDKQKVKDFLSGEQAVETPTSPNGCYGKIMRGGYVLLLGVGQEKNTLIHCIEEALLVPKRLTKDKKSFKIINKDGSEISRELYWFYTDEIDDVSENFGKLEAPFRHFGAIVDGKIGNAKAMLCSGEKMLSALKTVYERSGGIELLADSLPLNEGLYK